MHYDIDFVIFMLAGDVVIYFFFINSDAREAILKFLLVLCSLWCVLLKARYIVTQMSRWSTVSAICKIVLKHWKHMVGEWQSSKQMSYLRGWIHPTYLFCHVHLITNFLSLCDARDVLHGVEISVFLKFILYTYSTIPCYHRWNMLLNDVNDTFRESWDTKDSENAFS